MANNGRVRSRQRSPPSPVRPLCQHTPARRVEQDGSYLATWWDHPDTLALSKALLYVEVEKIAVWGAQVFDEMVANRYTLMSAGLEPDSSVLYLPKSRDNRHTARKAQAETKRWQELVDLEREECRLWEKRYNDREALLPEIEPVSEARNSPVPLLQAQAQARKADARLIKALESSSSAMQKELKDLGRDSEAARKSLEVKLEHARRELTKERERVVELKDLSKLTKTKAEAREQELVDQLQAAQAEVEKHLTRNDSTNSSTGDDSDLSKRLRQELASALTTVSRLSPLQNQLKQSHKRLEPAKRQIRTLELANASSTAQVEKLTRDVLLKTNEVDYLRGEAGDEARTEVATMVDGLRKQVSRQSQENNDLRREVFQAKDTISKIKTQAATDVSVARKKAHAQVDAADVKTSAAHQETLKMEERANGSFAMSKEIVQEHQKTLLQVDQLEGQVEVLTLELRDVNLARRILQDEIAGHVCPIVAPSSPVLKKKVVAPSPPLTAPPPPPKSASPSPTETFLLQKLYATTTSHKKKITELNKEAEKLRDENELLFAKLMETVG